jgi:predicted acetylornithine/succinylornithine family transaminase
MATIAEREQQVYMPTFRRQPVVLVRGEGCYVWDDQGRRYLDLVAGIAVDVLGHSHPRLVRAIAEQAGTLIQVSNLYYSVPQIELAEMLVRLTGMDQVFFANSGAEANEGAIKLARKFGKTRRDGAFEIITAVHSFHGRTLATLSATGQVKYQQPFTPLPQGFTHVPYNDLDALRAATTKDTVAIMLEPVQGESGIHAAAGGYLRAVREWCNDNGLLLILDEIQSGVGRTGTFLAAQGYGVEPDVVTLAKGMCGGLPAGAVLARRQFSCFEPGDHGSTLGGNPLVCAAGVATLDTIEEERLMENAARVGSAFLRGLESLQKKHGQVRVVRGRGLMLALDLHEPRAGELVDRAREQGVLVNSTGPCTIRMVPPLVLHVDQVEEALDVLDRVVGAL